MSYFLIKLTDFLFRYFSHNTYHIHYPATFFLLSVMTWHSFNFFYWTDNGTLFWQKRPVTDFLWFFHDFKSESRHIEKEAETWIKSSLKVFISSLRNYIHTSVFTHSFLLNKNTLSHPQSDVPCSELDNENL